MTGRRVRELRASCEVLVALLSLDGSRAVRLEGMPADARIVGVADRVAERGCVALYVESGTFDPVPPGCAPGPLTLTATARSVVPGALLEGRVIGN